MISFRVNRERLILQKRNGGECMSLLLLVLSEMGKKREREFLSLIIYSRTNINAVSKYILLGVNFK